MTPGGFSQQKVVTDPDALYATRAEVHDLADKVVGLHGAVQDHDAHAATLVADALATMLEKLPAALEQATERAMRRVATDQTLHGQIGASILSQSTRNLHETAGKWLFSRWVGVALLVFILAQYIGWAATLKAILGLFKGGA